MCGILGVVGPAKPTVTPLALQRALDLLRHRGPDDEGYLLFDAQSREARPLAGADTDRAISGFASIADQSPGFDVAFAHRRLSILDISSAGHQPMRSPDGRFWIVLNGEVYNFLELRRELIGRGYAFTTQSDTEVLLAAYAEWHDAMLPRLIGMFAIAILDIAAGTVFLARDPFGIKPLYYARLGSAFAFASEISPLLALMGTTPTADVDALYRYLRLGVTDGHADTMFAAVRQLPAAHCMTIGVDGIEHGHPRPYWTPSASARRQVSLSDAATEMRGLLDESVRLHLRSDVPLGVCLSGGLDSTAIVGAMRALIGPDEPIHTFSFESGDPKTGEAPYIELAARTFGLTRHSVSPSAQDLVRHIDALVRLQEQPFGSTSIFAQHAVFQLSKAQGMTVLLDGQGADELFGGYRTAISAQLASALLRGNLRTASSLISSNHLRSAGERWRVLLSAAGRLLPSALAAPFMALVGEAFYPSWLDGDWFRARGHRAAPRPQGRGRYALREELLHFVSTLSLPHLLRYEDRNSMAFSLESRVPFCTTAIANFAFSLPTALHIAPDGQTKAVLRRAVTGRVPAAIITRAKVGFETPERSWLRTLQPWIREVVNSDHFRALPFVHHGVVESTIIAQLEGRGTLSPAVWRILNTAVWAREFGVSFR